MRWMQRSQENQFIWRPLTQKTLDAANMCTFCPHRDNTKWVCCLRCTTRPRAWRGCYIICSDFPGFLTDSFSLVEGRGPGQGSAGWIRMVPTKFPFLCWSFCFSFRIITYDRNCRPELVASILAWASHASCGC